MAGVDNGAQWGGDGKRQAKHNGVRHVDKFDLQWTDVHLLPGLNFVELSLLGEVVLLQSAVNQSQREGGTINRHIQLGKQEGDATDVVLMPVGEHQAPPHRFSLFQVRKIRSYDV